MMGSETDYFPFDEGIKETIVDATVRELREYEKRLETRLDEVGKQDQMKVYSEKCLSCGKLSKNTRYLIFNSKDKKSDNASSACFGIRTVAALSKDDELVFRKLGKCRGYEPMGKQVPERMKFSKEEKKRKIQMPVPEERIHMEEW